MKACLERKPGAAQYFTGICFLRLETANITAREQNTMLRPIGMSLSEVQVFKGGADLFSISQ